MTATLVAPTFRRDRLSHAWLAVKALSDAGDAIWTIALAWTAVHVAGPATAGLVVAAGTVPRAAVLLVGGAVADRTPARPVLIATNLVRIAVLVGTATWVSAATPGVGVLLAAGIAFGLCDAFYEPSAATIGRQLVTPEDLPSYTGLQLTLSRLGTMGGAAAGGFLVARTGLAGSASIDAATFALVVAFLAIWLRPRFPLDRAPAEPVVRQVARGFAHLVAAPVTRTLVIALSGLNLAIGPALSLGLPLLAREEAWGASVVGYLEALVGLGSAAGALLMLRWRPLTPVTLGFASLVLQACCIAAFATGALPIAVVASLTVGVTAGIASALLGAVFAATVSETHFGRMVSIQRLGDDVLMPAAMAGFGALAAGTSLPVAFATFGVGMGLLMVWPLANPTLRGLRLAGQDG